MIKLSVLAIVLTGLSWSQAFTVIRTPQAPQQTKTISRTVAAVGSPLFGSQHDNTPQSHNINKNKNNKRKVLRSWFSTLRQRSDTLTSAGVDNALTAGIFSKIKRIHDPITYLVLFAIAGFRYEWCFRNPYYWFVVGFCIKWYVACIE